MDTLEMKMSCDGPNHDNHEGSKPSPVYVLNIPGELGDKGRIATLTKVEGQNPKVLRKIDDNLVRLSSNGQEKEQNGRTGALAKDAATVSDSIMKSVSKSASLNSISQKPDKESLTRKPFQKFCNMAHISCSERGRISYNYSTIPVFCTVGNLDSLLPSTSVVDDIPAYILTDHANGIKAIMAENLLPVSYLISRSSFHHNNRVAVFMPDKSQAEDENMNVVPWHVQRVMLSPYLASPIDPFPRSELIMLGDFSDTFPTVDISCLDFEDIVTEIENSQEQASSTYYQYGPECSHFYYYLMLSKLPTIQMVPHTAVQKFKLRINFVDKALQLKKKLAKARKQKAKKTSAPSTKLTNDKIINGDTAKKLTNDKILNGDTAKKLTNDKILNGDASKK